MSDRPSTTLNSPPRRILRAASALRAVTVSLPFVAVTVSALLFAGDLSAQTPLSVGRTLSGSFSEGDTARYSFEAGEDYFVLGEVDQVSADVDVRVLGPDGETPWGNSSGPGRGAERFAVRPPEAGAYTVELTPSEGESGDYTVTLLRLEPLETDPEKLTNQLMSRYDGEDSPGAAVQVWRDGETLFSSAYGMANLGYGIPFATDTRTNIGSTSKQFTAFAIMLQAERGLLSLDDDIRKHIPELPEFDHTISVRHLITHTSGLREFLNLTRMTGRRLDRGDWIDRSEIIDIVQRQPALQNEPGAEWNYNNTAFGLAAVIVERTSGQDFPTFMRDNVFEPLGMTRTLVRPSPIHIVPEMSEGYTPGPDGFLQIGDLGGAAGAGGMYSTLDDLQAWVENYANARIGSAGIFEEMMTSYVLSDGEETGYGYGLSVDQQRGLRRVSHGGADVAHRSMLAYYPEINAGITTQSNHAGFNSAVAYELAEAFFADAMKPEDAVAEEADEGAFDPADYDPEDFDDFAGRYALDETPAFILTFTREDDTFYAEPTGQPRLAMVPTSDSTFAISRVEATIIFHRGEDGTVSRMTLDQNGLHPGTRVPGAEEGDDPEALADFEGRYFSEEIETFFEIVLADGELVMKQRRLDDATLEPGQPDTFSGGGFTFRFERDRNGQVIGFYLSNGRTRDVRFGRVR
ncbi:MAG: serine hydrolase [Gammaproteobacteria bacterium]|nr:serine hydrolase [Gammaproteobacteria bacterium]MDE0651464.1 serine hydrolase [Gammaproteobacteria bacterium]